MDDDFKNKKQKRNPSVHGTVFFLIAPLPLELFNLMMTNKRFMSLNVMAASFSVTPPHSPGRVVSTHS